MAGDQTDDDQIDSGALLASRLRQLGQGATVTLVRTGQGFQAAMKVDAGFRVDICDDPIDALLVATGAVHTPVMNRRDQKRRIASLHDQAEEIGRRLSAEDMELLG